MNENWEGTYNAALDSVNLLNAGKPSGDTDEQWADSIKRNVEHLKIQLRKDWPEEFDLTPLSDAVAAHEPVA